MRRILSLLVGLAVSAVSAAQELPILQTQVFDQYMSNPAMIAIDRYSQMNLVYRKQWTDVPNAPSTLGINGQFVVTPRISLGGMVMHDRSVILSATTALATFAYQVPFAADHFVNFGLSGGFYSDRIRMDGLDNVSDPALYSNDSRFLGHVQFGMAYVYKRLRLGFALPQMLDTYTRSEDTEHSFSPLRAKIFSATYSIPLSADITFDPYGQYYFDQNKKSFVELGGTFGYKSVIRVGGFYRDEMGLGVLVQLAPTEKLLVGYSYQTRSNSSTSFGGSSHEFQLKLRFGRKHQNAIPIKRQLRRGAISAMKEAEQAPVTVATPEATTQSTAASSSDYTPTQLISSYSRADIETSKPDEPPYLVVGCFRNLQNAERLLGGLINRYPDAGLGYINSRQLYFVYAKAMSSSDDVSVDAILNIRSSTSFKDAWFMKLQQERERE